MKTLSALLLSLLFSFTAHADSPEASVRKVNILPLTCNAGKLDYTIYIDAYFVTIDGKTVEMLAGAQLEISRDGKAIKQLTLPAGDFEYGLGAPGIDDSFFHSQKAGLKLNHCYSPLAGGVSIGN